MTFLQWIISLILRNMLRQVAIETKDCKASKDCLHSPIIQAVITFIMVIFIDLLVSLTLSRWSELSKTLRSKNSSKIKSTFMLYLPLFKDRQFSLSLREKISLSKQFLLVSKPNNSHFKPITMIWLSTQISEDFIKYYSKGSVLNRVRLLSMSTLIKWKLSS